MVVVRWADIARITMAMAPTAVDGEARHAAAPGEVVADLLCITQPTFNEHLPDVEHRAAERVLGTARPVKADHDQL